MLRSTLFCSTGVENKKLIQDFSTGGSTYSKCGESQEISAQQWRRRAGLEDLKGQKGEKRKKKGGLEIKPSPQVQWTDQCSTLDAWQINMLQ